MTFTQHLILKVNCLFRKSSEPKTQEEPLITLLKFKIMLTECIENCESQQQTFIIMTSGDVTHLIGLRF